MATKTHSYCLRVRTSASKGAKGGTSSSKPADFVVPQAGPAENPPSMKMTYDPEPSKTKKSSTKRSIGSIHTASRTSNKKTVVSSRTYKTGTLADVSDMEDYKPAAVYTFGEEEAASIQPSLLSWYDENHRVLPWRKNPHSLHQLSGESKGRTELSVTRELSSEQQRAYDVWVSEMMLQQTRVETVLVYYHKWIEKWPTLHHLAAASLEDVYSLWAGLGYYRRARFLLEGAKKIMEDFSGVFPESVTELRNIPGIGQYTAGAIASIAFNRPAPLVDGNVVRVLCRLRAISESPQKTTTVKQLWALAGELVDAKRPGDLNQALMELGATLCTPKNPGCEKCPISSHCQALSLASLEKDDPEFVESVTAFPIKVVKVPPRDEFFSVCLVEVLRTDAAATKKKSTSDMLLMQRPQEGLLAGLWEFPQVFLGKVPVSGEERNITMDCYLKKHLNIDLSVTGLVLRREALGTLVHVFSHIRWNLSVERLVLAPSGGLQKRITEFRGDGDPVKWVPSNSLKELGLTTSVRKICDLYLKHLKIPRQTKSDSW